MSITRLAPSPTGALHLGNARTFFINWLLARQNDWQILLRIDNLDGPRIKRGADKEAIEDLQWLGLTWDQGPVYQSTRVLMYSQAVNDLVLRGLAYPCVCSRKDIESAASAPHAEDGAVIYPGTCRGKFRSVREAQQASGRTPAIRFIADGFVAFEDRLHGRVEIDVGKRLGDFVIAKADGTASYQLATVLDDTDAKVDQVVRGDDLLDSAPRQILLYEAMGMMERVPEYTHLPLVVGEDGRRLAKRHGDTRLSYYRQQGVAPGRIVALLARWCGIADTGDEVMPGDLVGRFDLSKVSKDPIVFTSRDDAWLLNR